jgi:hypothetical protein
VVNTGPEEMAMVYYYLYMGLLIVVLILWAVIAVREDDHDNGETNKPG